MSKCGKNTSDILGCVPCATFLVFTILWCHLCSWNIFLIEPHLRLQILLYVIQFYIISSVMYAFWLVLAYDLLEDRCIDDVIIKTFFNSLLCKTNRFQVVVRLFSNRSQRTSKCGKNINDTLSCALCATFLILPHFDVICDLLLNRRTAIWNLFAKYLGASVFPRTRRIY